jgi:sulfatase modifying factor 1
MSSTRREVPVHVDSSQPETPPIKGPNPTLDRVDPRILALVLLIFVSTLILSCAVGSFLYSRLSPVVRSWFGDGEPHSGAAPSGVLAKPGGEVVNSLGMRLRLIPADAFDMGSGPSDKDARPEEKVQGKKHRVRITRPFYMAETEVTVGQFRLFAEKHRPESAMELTEGVGVVEQDWPSPGFPQGGDHPVVYVTWHDAVNFCNWLSEREGRKTCYDSAGTVLDLFSDGYRLPTEAEWEYCCRAGRSTVYYSGDDPKGLVTVGNVADEAGYEFAGNDSELRSQFGSRVTARDGFGVTAPVGRFQANAFGLHDMHGNVAEWCSDVLGPYRAWDGVRDDPIELWDARGERVIRGGGWRSGPEECRSAARSSAPPVYRAADVGFRVVLQNPGDGPSLRTRGLASYASSLSAIRAGMIPFDYDGFRNEIDAVLAVGGVTPEEASLAAEGIGPGGSGSHGTLTWGPGRADHVATVLRALDGWTVDDVRQEAERLRDRKDPDRFRDSHRRWRWCRMIVPDILSARVEEIRGFEVQKPMTYDGEIGLGPKTRRCLVVRFSLTNLSRLQTA